MTINGIVRIEKRESNNDFPLFPYGEGGSKTQPS
jgi:hypothetical protein